MLKSFSNLTINNLKRQYSTSLNLNGYGGLQPLLNTQSNQSVQFSTPIKNGKTIIFQHSVEQVQFQPTKINKRTIQHDFKEQDIEEMKKLRVQNKMSLDKIAEKYKTKSKVVSALTKSDPAVRQIQIDNYRIKGQKVVEPIEVRKARLEEWTNKNQQREYDLKVIKAAESHERIIRQRRDINEMNNKAHQDSYDMILKNQSRDELNNQVKYLTQDEKKSRAKMLANLRRRKVVDDNTKKQEISKRQKNKSAKKSKKDE